MAIRRSKTNNNDSDKIKCQKCRKLKSPTPTNYYLNNHPLFNWDKFEVCKDCTNEFIGEKNSMDYLPRVYSMLALLDKPFLADLWIQRDEDWKKYIPTLSSMNQYKGLTFKDSNFGFVSHDLDSPISEDLNYEIDDDAARRWEGFDASKARKLEDFYQELISVYEHGTPIQRNLYKNITITQIQADEAIANNDHKKYKELMETMSKLMNDANIKPVQETGAEANGISSFGEFIKMIEETEPIPEPRDEFKDVDGIGKYIDKWFLHHMKRFLNITNDTMEQYDEKTHLSGKED